MSRFIKDDPNSMKWFLMPIERMADYHKLCSLGYDAILDGHFIRHSCCKSGSCV